MKSVTAAYGQWLKGRSLRFLNVLLACFLVATTMVGCTLKRPPVPAGVIPEYTEPTPGAQAFGRKLLDELEEDYELANNHSRYEQLGKTLGRLLRGIGADPAQWRLCLFDEADLIDVRAVYGNYIFVWSGLLDFVENEDEIAGLLACEIAHVLANHANPAEFTLLSRVFFSTAEIAASVGLLILSQGAVAVGGQGWMQYAYAEAVDLDPLDREYSEEEEREAVAIALLMLDRSGYPLQAMLAFWRRLQEVCDKIEKKIGLNRSMSLEKRLALLEELVPPGRREERLICDNAQKGSADLAVQGPNHSDDVESSVERVRHRKTDHVILAPL